MIALPTPDVWYVKFIGMVPVPSSPTHSVNVFDDRRYAVLVKYVKNPCGLSRRVIEDLGAGGRGTLQCSKELNVWRVWRRSRVADARVRRSAGCRKADCMDEGVGSHIQSLLARVERLRFHAILA